MNKENKQPKTTMTVTIEMLDHELLKMIHDATGISMKRIITNALTMYVEDRHKEIK